MSEINPRNIDGANAVIVGRAGGPVEIKRFDNGGAQAQLSIAVGTGYKKGEEWVETGTNWYTLTATEDYAAENWPDVQTGDKVRVENTRIEFKPYLKNDKSPAVEATLRYGTLVVLEAKSNRAAVKGF